MKNIFYSACVLGILLRKNGGASAPSLGIRH